MDHSEIQSAEPENVLQLLEEQIDKLEGRVLHLRKALTKLRDVLLVADINLWREADLALKSDGVE